ncbi:MAG: hypothetical protein GY861_02950 [bacterium]|nr:hypothetical protein [bacterium]
MTISKRALRKIEERKAKVLESAKNDLDKLSELKSRKEAVSMNICPFCGADLEVKGWVFKKKICKIHGRVDD